MKTLLWVGDAVVSSGFARITHNVLAVLRKEYKIGVLGINYMGDPHPLPYPIWPCAPGGDGMGVKRIRELAEMIRPDIIVILQDPWNMPPYMKEIRESEVPNTPVVAFMAVDGKNCRGRALRDVDMAVFWTEFAQAEAKAGGYDGPSAVVPLGVNLDIYKPMDKIEARRRVGLPPRLDDAFLVLNMNRNQPRKRLDLSIQYFSQWIQSRNVRDAYLMLHVCPTGDDGYDIDQLAEYYGPKWPTHGLKAEDMLDAEGMPVPLPVDNRHIVIEPELGFGVPEEVVAATHAAADVAISTTQGEGWGLPALEGMACGLPQILPDWSAYGEWTRGTSWLIPCSSTIATPHRINSIGGIVDREMMIGALDRLYRDRVERRLLSRRGIDLAGRPEYRWPAIGAAFADAIRDVVCRNPAPAAAETAPADAVLTSEGEPAVVAE